MRKRLLTKILAVAMSAALLTACGSPDNGGSTGSQGSSQAGSSQAESSAQESGDSQEGGQDR